MACSAPAYLFTVFTATYNRAHVLHRVYDSLMSQIDAPPFEWLIVDDGSIDETRELVAAWAAAAPFPIRYLYQANGGQHMACNRGLQHARGELFAMIDSDDAAPADLLARMADLWRSIPEAERPRFAGVGGLCVDEHGRLVGDRYPRECYDANALQIYFRDRLVGQKWWCTRTTVLRRFRWLETPYKSPNPWYRISEHYRWRLVNEVANVFYQDNAEDSISRAKSSLVPGALLHRCELCLTRYIGWSGYHPLKFANMAAHYVRCSLHLGRGWTAQVRRLPWVGRLLWAAALPVGGVLWLRDKQRRIRIKR